MAVPWTQSMISGTLLVIQLFLWICNAEIEQIGDKCLKNKEYGDYATNTYYCKDPALPACCEVDSEFTCCEEQSDHALKHQMILWGAVFGVVGLVAFIWVCYRKDTYMCEGETLNNRMRRCCGCEKKVNPDDEKVELSDLSDNNDQSLQWTEDGGTKTTHVDPYYDAEGPVTSRGITPVMPTHDPRGYGDGNDSDSGRGSTTSIDGGRSAHRSRESTADGHRSASELSRPGSKADTSRPPSKAGNRPDEIIDVVGVEAPPGGAVQPNSEGAASATKDRKKKKKKGKKKKHLHDVAEEDANMEEDN